MDGVTLEEFETDLKNNLYQIWNRMSSGSYFPPPVKAVEIPKPHGGGTRMLGVPTVADRIAQTVVAARLETKVEPIFHPDSYGYRPGRSALDAVAACRQRCWKNDWVIDLDVREVLRQRAVGPRRQGGGGTHRPPWVVLYVQAVAGRAAAAARRDLAAARPRNPAGVCGLARAGEPVPALRVRRVDGPGVPGRASSSATPTTRWCTASASARPARCWPRSGTGWPRSGCGCTRPRPGSCTARTATGAARTSTRRSRSWGSRSAPARRAGKNGVNFTGVPARDQQGRPEQDERGGPPLAAAPAHRPHLAELARKINPIVRGWMQYYGAFYRSALYPLLRRINAYLMRWIRRKYKRLRPSRRPSRAGSASPPAAAALRPLGMDAATPGDQDDKSRVTGDCHARI